MKYTTFAAGKKGTFVCAGATMIGGRETCGTKCKISKLYEDLAPHNFVHLQVDVFWIDSWDNEWLIVSADDVPVFSQTKAGNLRAVSSILPSETLSNLCGATNYNDDRGILDIVFFHNQSTLDLSFSSSLNSAPSDESWGIVSVDLQIGIQGTLHLIV